MKWFIILACLVAAQFAHGANVQNIRGVLNSTLELKLQNPYRDLLECTVINNEGQKFILIPDEKNKHQLYIRNLFSLFRECKPQIQVTSSRMEGKWRVEQTFYENLQVNTKQKTVTEEFYVQLKDILEPRDIVPVSTLQIYEGNYAIFKFAEVFPTLKSCILTNETVEIDLLSEEYSYLRIHEDGVCGIRMMVQQNYAESTWKLYANLESNASYYGSFTIKVLQQEKDVTNSEIVYFELGEKAVLKFSPSNVRMTFCQIEDPTGKKLDVNVKCEYEIPIVTKLHRGVWKFFYGIEGSNTPMEDSLTVSTFENARLNSSVTFGANNRINLLCRIRGRNAQYCRFTRPDNMSFSVSPGVGNERYEYYGMGFKSSSMLYDEVSDCGLSIRSPSAEDFGTWKCMIGMNDKVTGAFLQINNMKTLYPENIKTFGSKVYVERGNQFTVKCSAEAELNYCWMLSPNGTVYSVSEKGNSPSHLFYEGSGLELGECGAIVTVADDTHHGEWSCRMGVVNGTELEASVPVTVTDSFLIPDENTIDISSKKPTILTWRTLPGSEATISYCRWIRPDGRGIHNHVDNQYVTERTLSSCKLTIQELNIGYDIGSWSCTAGLEGPTTIETTSRIQINYSFMGLGSFVAVALTIALLVITTITLFVIIVRKRRTRYADEKPIIYK